MRAVRPISLALYLRAGGSGGVPASRGARFPQWLRPRGARTVRCVCADAALDIKKELIEASVDSGGVGLRIGPSVGIGVGESRNGDRSRSLKACSASRSSIGRGSHGIGAEQDPPEWIQCETSRSGSSEHQQPSERGRWSSQTTASRTGLFERAKFEKAAGGPWATSSSTNADSATKAASQAGAASPCSTRRAVGKQRA
jgi:hypothetical protein